MKRYVYSLIALLLTLAALDLSSPAQVHKTRTARAVSSAAQSGFYIQFEMCHACAYYGWQKDAVSALGKSGVPALVSDDVSSHYTQQPYWTLRALRLRGVRTEDWPIPVYAGPFESEYAARQTLSQLPSILKTALDKFDKQRAEIRDTTRWSRQFKNCSGNQCDLAGYSIQLVRLPGNTIEPRGPSGSLSQGDWNEFWPAFGSAIQKRDRIALRKLTAASFETNGGGDWTPNQVIKWLDQDAWRQIQKSVALGTKPYTYSGQRRAMRITKDEKQGSPYFELGTDGRWRWKGVLGD